MLISMPFLCLCNKLELTSMSLAAPSPCTMLLIMEAFIDHWMLLIVRKTAIDKGNYINDFTSYSLKSESGDGPQDIAGDNAEL